ncbi:MAG: Gfo/Idh/MocA family oxidoreductase [Chloroflexi bacterium]|nr:Gfo/Idh/MocA family oxidoreductase [Chloroflexota bacterium]MCL5274705.1 Gfo/Idh/MocA family oxidoreductase [Chloroflexota bacterium]
MANQLRVGFIGAGGMAREHAKGLRVMNDVVIAAVTDVVRDRAAALAATLGAATYDTPEQMLRDAGLDAVYILLPPFAHGEAERAALAARLPFFVEKPVGLDLGLSRELAREVEYSGLLTCAGYMNRHRKSVNRARDLLSADPAVLVHGGWIGGSPKPGPDYSIVHWWIQKDKSGGQFHEQVTHTIDLLRYLCGEAEEVFAYSAAGFNRDIPGYTIDDAAVVNIKLRSGGVANLMACTASNADGGVWLNVYAGKTAFKFTGWEHTLTIKRAGGDGEEIAGEPDIFAVEDRIFLDAVRSGDRSGIRSTYPDAVKTLEISVAASQSIASGKPVHLTN